MYQESKSNVHRYPGEWSGVSPLVSLKPVDCSARRAPVTDRQAAVQLPGEAEVAPDLEMER
jgi:hypothetical protein